MPTRPRIVLLDVQNVMHAVGELRHIMSRRSQREAIDRLKPRCWLTFWKSGCSRTVGARKLTGDSVGCWRVGAGNGCADNQIIAWLQRHPQRRPVLLVSGDRDLCLRAKAMGSRFMSPESFWRKFIKSRSAS